MQSMSLYDFCRQDLPGCRNREPLIPRIEGSCGAISENSNRNYAELTRNLASRSVKNPSMISIVGDRERYLTEVKRCSGHPFRYCEANW